MGDLSGGLGITTGAAACGKIIETYGVKKVGIITPYQEIGDQQVVNFFTEIGCEVMGIYGMRCQTATSISEVTKEEVKEAFRRVDGEEVELLIQAGTNLLAGKAAAEMEVEHGKPVIAINTATVWHAYRSNGIMDQIKGWDLCWRSIKYV
jgi:maleate isomerase